MYETRRVQHHVTSGYISIVAADRHLPAFWAHPEIGGSFPGLVLIHEAWGLTPQIRRLVRLFAELGFYVIAPDLFNGQVAQTPEQATLLQQQLGEAGAPRVNASLSALATHHRCNGKLGVIGFEMGGTLALHVALHRTDLRAAVMFDGLSAELMVLLRACQTPLLGLYGERSVPGDAILIAQMRAALKTSNTAADCKLVEYPDAMRGFFDEGTPTYEVEAATDAWNQTLDFLCDHMDAGTLLSNSPPDPM